MIADLFGIFLIYTNLHRAVLHMAGPGRGAGGREVEHPAGQVGAYTTPLPHLHRPAVSRERAGKLWIKEEQVQVCAGVAQL